MSNWKLMVTVAVHRNQIIAWDNLNRDETMNSIKFLEFLQNVLAPAIRRIRLRHPIILMDNSRVHFTDEILEYIDAQGWEILEHPPW